MRVNSQYNLSQTQKRSSERTLQQMALERQINTNTRAKDLADIGRQKMDAYVSAKTIKNRIENYIQNIDTTITHLDTYDVAFDAMQDIVDTMKNLLKNAEGVDQAKRLGLPKLAEEYLGMLQGILNSKEDTDTYIFHGKDGRAGWADIAFKLDEENATSAQPLTPDVPIIPDPVTNKILDDVTGAAAAYSLRQLDSDYAGNAIRLRRDSDGAEMDFGFDANGDLDIAAIEAWRAEKTTLEFDGISGNIEVSANPEVNNIFAGGGKIEATITPQTLGESQWTRIVQKANGNNDNGYVLYLSSESGGQAKLSFISDFTGSEGRWETTNRDITIGAESKIEIEYDNSSPANDPILRINGIAVPVTKSTIPSGIATSDETENLFIGNRENDDRTFDGTISDVKFYDTSTGSDVLKAAWDLDEGTGATAIDTLGTSNGTITGATWNAPDLHVTTWYDQSGNGFDAAQGTEGGQPLLELYGSNGKPEIMFDGSNDMLNAGDQAGFYSNTDGQSIFAMTSSTTSGHIISKYNAWNSTREFLLRKNAYNIQPNPASYDSQYIANGSSAIGQQVSTSIWDPNIETSLYENGTLSASAATAASSMIDTNADILIGGVNAGIDQYYQGGMSEIVVYAEALATPDRQSFETDTMDYWLSTPPAPTNKILDDITGAAAAYSLRKLDDDYTGDAIRLRRNSDNAEMDFGFDAAGDLDITAIEAWLGGATGYVLTWYDQSGAGKDIDSPADPTHQPRLLLSNGPTEKPAVDFDGGDVLTGAGFPDIATESLTMASVHKFDALGWRSLAATEAFRYSANILHGGGVYLSNSPQISDLTQQTAILDRDNTLQSMYREGNLLYTRAGNASYATDLFSLGMNSIDGNNPVLTKTIGGAARDGMDGQISEFIIFDSALSSNRATLEDDQMDYWLKVPPTGPLPASTGDNDGTEKIMDRMEDLGAGTAKAAYSLRRIDQDYNGPALRIRNSITNEEADIYFDAQGNLERNLLALWQGASAAEFYVTKWYDQSGAGKDAIQTERNYQPRLEIDGMNGNPSLDFDGGDILAIDHAGELVTGNDITLSSFVSYDTVSGTNRNNIYVQNDVSGGRTTHQFSINASGQLNYDNYDPLGGAMADTEVLATGEGFNASMIRNDLSVGFIKDANYGALQIAEAEDRESAAVIDNNLIGGRFFSGAVRHGLDGDMSELIIYDKALTSDQQRVLNADSVKQWNNIMFGDYKTGVALPNVVTEPLSPDAVENLSAYNHMYKNASHGKTYDTYKTYETMISDTQKVEVNYSPYEAAIQNLAYGLDLVRQIVDANPSNTGTDHPGVPYTTMMDAALKFFEASEAQFGEIKAEINMKKISLNERKTRHESDLDFYDTLLNDLDGAESEEKLAMQARSLSITAQMSYAITANLSRSNLMRALF
ncbi:MAG: hypothetical protein ACTSXQ_01350 [Alphaproteobacteria bacterium]